MYENTIFQFKKMLSNLDGWMEKAAGYADQKKFDINVLAHTRLAPDMYDFVKQVQSSCDSAKFCAAYLTGQTAPKHEDNEKTWSELRARVKKAIGYLETVKTKDFANSASVKVAPKWAEGKWLNAGEYVDEVAVPNFYFHISMAYALLRHAGVNVGKMDFIGHVDFKK